ncbi:MAG: hypothetical protein CVU39_16065 [Chloroflexi bacterium HGW-Chloroflexi-10]|nr:MAG: hypothetical protein CVU39_16065 [Chloroflexi bacterium HGW-Chloroflexi-10]
MKAITHAKGQIKAPAKKVRTAWWLPAGLILLSIIPLIFGIARLNQLANGAEITAGNARFFASPSPVVIHIITAAVYALLGAFQFVSRLWKHGTGWHRWVGRFLVPIGLLVGFSGMWMTIFYPRPEGPSDLLYAFRLFFGLGMTLSIILGFISIRRRNINQHRAWMTRAYAIGLGAGTQVLTGMVGALLIGVPNEFENALLMGAAWVINLAVAEWAIRKRPSVRAPRSAAVGSHAR